MLFAVGVLDDDPILLSRAILMSLDSRTLLYFMSLHVHIILNCGFTARGILCSIVLVGSKFF